MCPAVLAERMTDTMTIAQSHTDPYALSCIWVVSSPDTYAKITRHPLRSVIFALTSGHKTSDRVWNCVEGGVVRG